MTSIRSAVVATRSVQHGAVTFTVYYGDEVVRETSNLPPQYTSETVDELELELVDRTFLVSMGANPSDAGTFSEVSCAPMPLSYHGGPTNTLPNVYICTAIYEPL